MLDANNEGLNYENSKGRKMRSFVSYWEEYRKELGDAELYELETGSSNEGIVAHRSILAGENESYAIPFNEGVLIRYKTINEENSPVEITFIPWHQISSIDFNKKDRTNACKTNG